MLYLTYQEVILLLLDKKCWVNILLLQYQKSAVTTLLIPVIFTPVNAIGKDGFAIFLPPVSIQ